MISVTHLQLAGAYGDRAADSMKSGYVGVATETARWAAHLAFLGCSYLGEGESRDPYLVRNEQDLKGGSR